MLRFAIEVLSWSTNLNALCSNTAPVVVTVTIATENVVATTKHVNTASSCMQTQLEIH